MSKKIAVLLRDRQSEAFRMSVGLIMMDDAVDVFVLDKKVSNDPDTQRNCELCKDMGLNLFTNNKENAGMEYLTTAALAENLLSYDIIDHY
ncbi:MAG TPA: hypothetical protein VJW95_05035 [Dissulfurispiraceae bacterium]|nr:hypothetical protein [Dissulfurispiraceae bacterium]